LARADDQLELSLESLPDPGRNTVGKFHAPRSDAPETEREAALAVYPRTGTARRRVLDAIALAGDRGMTDEELSLSLELRLYTAAPRRHELLEDGWVEDSQQRRPTTTGSLAVVWKLTPAGWDQWHGWP
jgi:hypothetical protein